VCKSNYMVRAIESQEGNWRGHGNSCSGGSDSMKRRVFSRSLEAKADSTERRHAGRDFYIQS